MTDQEFNEIYYNIPSGFALTRSQAINRAIKLHKIKYKNKKIYRGVDNPSYILGIHYQGDHGNSTYIDFED